MPVMILESVLMAFRHVSLLKNSLKVTLSKSHSKRDLLKLFIYIFRCSAWGGPLQRMEQARHPISGIITMKVRYGSNDKAIRFGLYGHTSPTHANYFKNLAASPNAFQNAKFYRYNEDIGFWFGTEETPKEQVIKGEKIERLEHFQYALTTYTSENDMTSNTFILVTNQDCSFLDTRHQLFGQVMDRESVDVIQEIINYVIIEAGMRVSENSEVKIMELTYEER